MQLPTYLKLKKHFSNLIINSSGSDTNVFINLMQGFTYTFREEAVGLEAG